MNKQVVSLAQLLGGVLAAAALVACGGDNGGVGGGNDHQADVLRWGTPEPISTGPVNEFTPPDIALSAEGSGHAVWVQLIGGDARVVGRRYVDGAWQALQVLSRSGSSVAPHGAQVALMANGEAIAVWFERVGNQPVVRGARTLNQQWQEPVLVSDAICRELSALALVSDGQAEALAVWTRQPTALAEFEVVAAPFRNNGFGPSRRVDAANMSAESPSVAMAANGRALIAWHAPDATNGVKRVYASAYSAGQFAVPVVVTASEALDAELPVVAMAIDGGATLAWNQTLPANGLTIRIATASDPMAQNWGLAQSLPIPRLEGDLAIARDSQGSSTVAWSEEEPLQPAHESVKSVRVGAHPVPLQIVDTTNGTSANSPALGVDARGGVVLAWTQDISPDHDDSLRQAFAARLEASSGQWLAPERIDAGLEANASTVSTLSLVVLPGGQAVAIWNQLSNAGVDVVFNVLK